MCMCICMLYREGISNVNYFDIISSIKINSIFMPLSLCVCVRVCVCVCVCVCMHACVRACVCAHA